MQKESISLAEMQSAMSFRSYLDRPRGSDYCYHKCNGNANNERSQEVVTNVLEIRLTNSRRKHLAWKMLNSTEYVYFLF